MTGHDAAIMLLHTLEALGYLGILLGAGMAIRLAR